MSGTPTVYIVDDEPGVRRALERLLRAEGLAVTSFGSPADFLAGVAPDAEGCVVLDVAMPGLDGLEVQRRLASAQSALPIVFLTGHGDIPMSVHAIKHGAVDFLTKPVKGADLLRAVRAALTVGHERAGSAHADAALRRRLDRLTPREREVLAHVIAGKLNKVIAADLGTGEQTIKVHRGRVMEKLEVASLADLVRVAQHLGIEPAP